MLFKNMLQTKNEASDLKNPKDWFMDLFGFQSSSGENVTAHSSLNVPTVYTCVNVLANSIATLPLQVYRSTNDGKRERAKRHNVAKLLEKRPNRYQSPFTFKHLAETHRNLWGNAYINIVWNAAGYPDELWLLNPAATEPVVDPFTSELWYWSTLTDGRYVRIHPDDMIHVKTLSLDGVKGKPPIQTSRETIGNSQAAQKFKGKFYQNGASPNGILKVPGQLNKEAKDKVREEWEKANTGMTNAQRVAILDAGLEFQSIGMPLKDAQFIESMKFDKTEIASIFNVPMHMVNELERATHSNIEQQSLDFIQNSLSPIIKQYEQEVEYKLFTDAELRRYYLKFNLASLLRGDSTSRSSYYKTMLEIGAYSINEVREYEDKDSIEGGDQHRVDLNSISLDKADEYQLAQAGGGENNE